MYDKFELKEKRVPNFANVLSVKLLIISYPSVLTFVLSALNETILLSTHNICFG